MKANRRTAKPANCGLNMEEFKRFYEACHRTFGYIGDDLPPGRISRYDLMDMIVDASRLREHGYREEPSWHIDDYRRWYDLRIAPMLAEHYGKNTPEWRKLVKNVFAHAYYVD
jgi:hypothetical protein